MKIEVLLLFMLVILGAITVCQGQDNEGDDGGNKNGGGLSNDFYKKSCPEAEKIVRNITWNRAASNPVLGSKLLRMHFHDCFLRGCDGSILLDPVGDDKVEKQAIPNLSLSGYDVIDDIKTELENVCPGIVSCADILALAARDAVSFQFQKLLWKVQTGRRDGTVSIASEAETQLPSPFADFPTLKKQYSDKNLDVLDLVVLSGAHSLGEAHCATFANARLYQYSTDQETDPSLDPSFAEFLKGQCPNPASPEATVEMDNGSSLTFDNTFYDNLLANKGVLLSDVALLQDQESASMVTKMSKNKAFYTMFGQSMKKMGAIEVLTGNAGEIRNHCRWVNQ